MDELRFKKVNIIKGTASVFDPSIKAAERALNAGKCVARGVVEVPSNVALETAVCTANAGIDSFNHVSNIVRSPGAKKHNKGLFGVLGTIGALPFRAAGHAVDALSVAVGKNGVGRAIKTVGGEKGIGWVGNQVEEGCALPNKFLGKGIDGSKGKAANTALWVASTFVGNASQENLDKAKGRRPKAKDSDGPRFTDPGQLSANDSRSTKSGSQPAWPTVPASPDPVRPRIDRQPFDGPQSTVPGPLPTAPALPAVPTADETKLLGWVNALLGVARADKSKYDVTVSGKSVTITNKANGMKKEIGETKGISYNDLTDLGLGNSGKEGEKQGIYEALFNYVAALSGNEGTPTMTTVDLDKFWDNKMSKYYPEQRFFEKQQAINYLVSRVQGSFNVKKPSLDSVEAMLSMQSKPAAPAPAPATVTAAPAPAPAPAPATVTAAPAPAPPPPPTVTAPAPTVTTPADAEVEKARVINCALALLAIGSCVQKDYQITVSNNAVTIKRNDGTTRIMGKTAGLSYEDLTALGIAGRQGISQKLFSYIASLNKTAGEKIDAVVTISALSDFLNAVMDNCQINFAGKNTPADKIATLAKKIRETFNGEKPDFKILNPKQE